jgi:hypothetical protein
LETIMPNPPIRPLPPRGSTDWGARQFYRLLDDEERIAAERERLRTMGWQPPQATDAFAAEPRFGDGRDAYADMLQQRFDARRALESEARRRAGESASGASMSVAQSGPGWVNGGRFSMPTPEDKLFAPVFYNSNPNQGGNARPQARASQEATQRNIMRGYTGQEGVGKLPPGYVPRYHGLNDEMAARQWSRAATYDGHAGQRAAAAAVAGATDPDQDSRSADVPFDPGLSAEFGDYFSGGATAATTRYGPGEAASVRLVVEAFSAAHIFLSESPETRQDNLDIIEMIQREVRACGREAEHQNGAGKPERILRQKDERLKGSRRPDGTSTVGDPDNPDYLFDFNTVDVLADGESLTAREHRAQVAIMELKARIDAERRTRFDTYPKSKGKDRARWRERIRPLVRKAVRELMNC